MTRHPPHTRDRQARVNLEQATVQVLGHPLFNQLSVYPSTVVREPLGRDTWAVIRGQRLVCDTRLADPQEWVWVLGHLLCHLGMGHVSASRLVLRDGRTHPWWNAAACLEVNSLLRHLRLGRCPLVLPEPPGGDPETLWRRWRDEPPAGNPYVHGVAAGGDLDVHEPWWPGWTSFEEAFAAGLQNAVARAVDVAGGRATSLTDMFAGATRWRDALNWFTHSYPLLGGLAAGLTLVEDAELCQRLDISVAAVDVAAGEIIVNPHRVLAPAQCRFVIAHEILHAALRHDLRAEGRDPFLWNIACDFVINGWLHEMRLGEAPEGALHDPSLAGWSAEEVYTHITRDLRRHRRLRTFRGAAGDVLTSTRGRREMDLDAFYRRALAGGLDYHRASGRGLLPAGLIEEIRARTHPPIGWRVELARWFDEQFPAEQTVRTFARLSRRQSSTPDLPRPARVRPDGADARTFAVLLDTSASMDTGMLAAALGAIASYAQAREVARVRVVFCDADPHDAGWLTPGEIAGRVLVHGRGGTVLQPGVDLLAQARDFPADGPLLIITDGDSDRLRVDREHAYLVPDGNRLPFPPKGPVFRLR